MPLPQILQGRLSLPVIGAPMFIVSGPDLVIAQCRAGIVGAFPALNARSPGLLERWLVRIERELAAAPEIERGSPVAPYAVNQIVHASNTRLAEDMRVCERHRVPIVITSLRPPDEVVACAHGWGGIVLHDAVSARHAEKAIEAGVDGLILVAAGAGGHAGTLNPFALLQEVRAFYDGPIALSGAIATGRAVLAALAAGADLAYVGTRFIATAEADADPRYKQMLVESAASDIVASSLFTGVSGNYLGQSIAAAGLDPRALPEGEKARMDFAAFAAKPWRDIWGAGQGVGAIRSVPQVAEIVRSFRSEFAEAQADLATIAASYEGGR